MNFKIIETNHELPDVLIYRDVDECGNEEVVILAIGANKTEGADEWFASETVQFNSPDSAKAFVRDYSKKSAEDFCKSQNVTYP